MIDTEDIFDAVNENSAKADETRRTAEEKARAEEARCRDAARAEEARRREQRMAYISRRRTQATGALLRQSCLITLLGLLILYTAKVRMIAPDLLPWLLLGLVAWLSYALGAWSVCMTLWRCD